MNDVFDTIKAHKGKRFIYGTGDGADKLLDYLMSNGIEVHGVCVSDDFYKERIFRGMKVLPISVATKENDLPLFMMAFGVKETDKIYKLSKEINLIYPEMPVCDTPPFTKKTVLKNEEKIKKAYSLLADEKSRHVYENIIQFRLSGDISLLKECETPPEEGYELILKPDREEIIFDCGAYKGDTIDDFLKYSNKVSELYAAEPCPKSFEKLKEKHGDFNLYNCAIGKEDGSAEFIFSRGRGSTLANNGKLTAGKLKTVPIKTVDSILCGRPCTVIKYDVEGNEADSISGSVETIKKYRPDLLVASYHKGEDIFNLPLLIDELFGGYKIYLRHHPCLPSWETNVYAVWEKQKN